MTNKTTLPSFQFASVPSEAQPDATELARLEIVNYIKSRLGPELCNAPIAGGSGMTYGEAIISSVSTGCYDYSWKIGDFSRVGEYISMLQSGWLRSQGDITPLTSRILHLRAFGSPEEKALLAQLGLE